MAVRLAMFRIWTALRGRWLRSTPALQLRVERSHHVDEAPPDADGLQDYHYAYDIYRFSDGTRVLYARSYADTPKHAHFLNAEVRGRMRPLRPADLRTPLLRAAAQHLCQAEGKRDLAWLSGRGNGYEPVPAGLLHPPAPRPPSPP